VWLQHLTDSVNLTPWKRDYYQVIAPNPPQTNTPSRFA
jgi:hypothetical protein